MGIHKLSSPNGLLAAAISLVMLTACSHNEQAKTVPAAVPKKQEVALKSKQIAELQKQKQAEAAMTNNSNKQIPHLLAETDSALRLAHQYQTNASKTKDARRKADLKQRADKAQAIADLKSSDLMALRTSLYQSLAKTKTLDSQIKIAVAEKQKAEQIANGTAPASGKNNLKHASAKRVAAAQAKKSM